MIAVYEYLNINSSPSAGEPPNMIQFFVTLVKFMFFIYKVAHIVWSQCTIEEFQWENSQSTVILFFYDMSASTSKYNHEGQIVRDPSSLIPKCYHEDKF